MHVCADLKQEPIRVEKCVTWNFSLRFFCQLLYQTCLISNVKWKLAQHEPEQAETCLNEKGARQSSSRVQQKCLVFKLLSVKFYESNNVYTF